MESGEYFKLRGDFLVENCAHQRAQKQWREILKSELVETLKIKTSANFIDFRKGLKP